MSGRALIDGFGAILLAPVALVVPLPTHAWHFLIASWLIHVLYLFTLIKSFEQADMSVAYPIARGAAPMLAALGAVTLFHESINAVVAIGIAIIGLGVVLIGLSHRVNRSALLWALLTGACIAGYTVIDAQGVRAAPNPYSYIVWVFLLMGGGIASAFALIRGRAFMLAAAAQWRPGLVAAVLSIASYGLALLALSLGATPRLAALRETSILFGAGIAVIFLKEKLTLQRYAGIGVIALGAITLIAAG